MRGVVGHGVDSTVLAIRVGEAIGSPAGALQALQGLKQANVTGISVSAEAAAVHTSECGWMLVAVIWWWCGGRARGAGGANPRRGT